MASHDIRWVRHGSLICRSAPVPKNSFKPILRPFQGAFSRTVAPARLFLDRGGQRCACAARSTDRSLVGGPRVNALHSKLCPKLPRLSRELGLTNRRLWGPNCGRQREFGAFRLSVISNSILFCFKLGHCFAVAIGGLCPCCDRSFVEFSVRPGFGIFTAAPLRSCALDSFPIFTLWSLW